MMVPAEDADVICIAYESSYTHSKPRAIELPYDPEVIWYERTRSLCYQPHPEYAPSGAIFSKSEEYFFDLIRYFMWDDTPTVPVQDNVQIEEERKVG
jgi:hypothetical protein